MLVHTVLLFFSRANMIVQIFKTLDYHIFIAQSPFVFLRSTIFRIIIDIDFLLLNFYLHQFETVIKEMC